MSLFDANWFARLDKVLRGDAEYQMVSRNFNSRVGFLIGAHEVSAHFADGGVCGVAVEPKLGAGWSFAFQADLETWNRFIAPLPPPLYQDIFSMIARLPEFRILGDRLAFMQNARAVQCATRLFRGVAT